MHIKTQNKLLLSAARRWTLETCELQASGERRVDCRHCACGGKFNFRIKLKKDEKMEEGSRKIQYLATFYLSLAFLSLGALSAWPTPVIHKFGLYQTNVKITPAGISWMVAMIPVGFMAGSFVSRFTADRMGRRATVLASAPLQALGSVIAVCAVEGWVLGIGVFLWNCSSGMLCTVVGIYIAETAAPELRATLSQYTRVAFSVGSLAVLAGGPWLSYEELNYALLPLPFVYGAACCTIPETPYFLLKEGRSERARRELARLRGYRDQKRVEQEADALEKQVSREMSRASSARELLAATRYRRALLVSAGLKFSQIMSGGAAIKQYLGGIMTEGGLTEEQARLGFLAFGVITTLAALLGSCVLERVGRRPLLVGTFLGAGLALVAGGALLRAGGTHPSAPGKYVPVAAVILSSVLSTVGYVPLSALIPAELFPLNVKAVALTSLNILGGALGFLSAKSYHHVKELVALDAVFWVYGGVAVFGALFSHFLVPETRGKTLEEIQKELQGDAYCDPGEAPDEIVLNGATENGVGGKKEGGAGEPETEKVESDRLTREQP